MELIVELEFITGNKETKIVKGSNPDEFADHMIKFNWFRLDDEYINMNNVRSFRVASKQEREEQEKRQAEETMEMLRSIRL